MADYLWTPVTLDAAFAPRDGAGALVFRGALWLVAGNNMRSDVWTLTRKH